MCFEATENPPTSFVETFDSRRAAFHPENHQKALEVYGLAGHPFRNFFPVAPLVSFRRQRNSREHIIKAKGAPSTNTT